MNDVDNTGAFGGIGIASAGLSEQGKNVNGEGFAEIARWSDLLSSGLPSVYRTSQNPDRQRFAPYGPANGRKIRR